MAARLRRALQQQLARNLAAAGTRSLSTRSSSFYSHSSSNTRRAVASSSSSWSFCNTNPAGAFNASYRWTTLRFRVSNSGYSTTLDSDDAGRREPLFPGCDYNHWLVTMEFQDPNTTREQKIDTFIKTLANVVGSVEEAKKRVYALSTTRYTGFMCEISEELSEKIKKEPGVEWVLPDSYADPIKKTYGVGDLYINGEIIPDPNPLPRPSARDRPRRRRDTMPVERRDIQINRDPLPLNMNQQQDYRGPSAPGYRSNVQPPSVHNYGPGPSNAQGPPLQNYGSRPVNNQGPPVQNYAPGPVNSQGLPVQNYGPGSMNQGPRAQNYGPGPMNNQGPPFQNYGPGPMNNQVPPFQSYGHGNYGPGPIHNQGPPVPNYAQNYGPGPANSQAYPGPGQDYQLNPQYTPAQSQWSPQGQDFRSQFNTQGAARQDYRGPPSPGPNYRQPSYTPGPPPHSYSPPPVQDYRPPISSSASFSAQDSSMSESKTDVPSIENGEKQQTVKSEDPEQAGKSDSYKWPIEESK